MSIHPAPVGCLQPTWEASRCTGCGLCAAACPCGAIALRDGLPVFACASSCTTHASCPCLVHCLFPCEDACPHGAIACGFRCEFEGHPA